MASNTVDAPLQAALTEFRAILDPTQEAELLALNQIPDANAVITFTAQVDEENAKRRRCCVASRLCGFLESVQQFSGVVDTMVSSNPAHAALIWGSIKFFFLTASRFTSYFNKVSEWFMNLRQCCPRYSDYAVLFPSSVRLRAALCKLYATVIQFCKQAIQVFHRTGLQHMVKAVWKPFESEFGSFTKTLKVQGQEVKEEIHLAADQAAFQERQLQDSYRQRTSLLSHNLIKESAASREQRLQVEECRSRKRKEKLLNQLSTYNYLAALKQERKKRCGMTSSWLGKCSEWTNWEHSPLSSVLWCSGILGSGKTVLVAKAIDDIFCLRSPGDTVSFFFCRFDEQQSLQASTILGSLIRQCLEPETLPNDVEAQLVKMFKSGPPDAEDLGSLLNSVVSTKQRHFVIIDALDECSKADQDAVLAVLSRVTKTDRKTFKVLLTSRESMSIEIAKTFTSYKHRTMRTPEVQADIKTYIEDVITEKINSGDLAIGTSKLVGDVCDALTEGAQGMFLYVAFQLNDICEQTSDEDIREVLRHLPKDLPETFERALSRISRSGPGKVKMVEKIFRWVAAAKRPLHIEELREAIAIELCQAFFMTEKLINDIDRLVPLCGSLVTLDEEEHMVQFAHHSVKKFLLSDSSSALPNNFHFQLSQADHKAGEICVTYLNFDDFKRQVAKVSSPRHPLNPRAILEATLSSVPGSKSSSSWSRIERLWNSRRESKFDTLNHLSHIASENNVTSFQKLSFRYVFLAYASEYWLSHTVNFEEHNTSSWSLWKHLLATIDPLAQVPWTDNDWTGRTRALTKYVVENNHCALLRLIEGSKPRDFPQTEKLYMLWRAKLLGYVSLFDLLLEPLLESGSLSDDNGILALFGAVMSGHPESVRRLLKAGVDVSTRYSHNDAKDVSEVIKRLVNLHLPLETEEGSRIQSSAYFRARSSKNNNMLGPLHLAAIIGQPSMIQILLEHGSDTEAKTQGDLQTALHPASTQGHKSAIQTLLRDRAEIKSPYSMEMTALHLAAERGHVAVVHLLLDRGACVETKNAFGRTALHFATQKGDVPVIQLLLRRNSDLESIDRDGFTALHLAVLCGHNTVVQLLLASNAHPETKDRFGDTALYWAASMEDAANLQLLITSGANLETKNNGGYTALFSAASGGHGTTLQLLITSGANLEARNGDAYISTHLAAEKGGDMSLELMSTSGANLETKNVGYTALQWVASKGDATTLQLLITSGANLETKDINGWTALHCAVSFGHITAAQLLITSGANLEAKNDRGCTALHFAVLCGEIAATQLLLSKGADVNAKDNSGDTVLHRASAVGDKKARKEIIKLVKAHQRR